MRERSVTLSSTPVRSRHQSRSPRVKYCFTILCSSTPTEIHFPSRQYIKFLFQFIGCSFGCLASCFLSNLSLGIRDTVQALTGWLAGWSSNASPPRTMYCSTHQHIRVQRSSSSSSAAPGCSSSDFISISTLLLCSCAVHVRSLFSIPPHSCLVVVRSQCCSACLRELNRRRPRISLVQATNCKLV